MLIPDDHPLHWRGHAHGDHSPTQPGTETPFREYSALTIVSTGTREHGKSCPSRLPGSRYDSSLVVNDRNIGELLDVRSGQTAATTYSNETHTLDAEYQVECIGLSASLRCSSSCSSLRVRTNVLGRLVGFA